MLLTGVVNDAADKALAEQTVSRIDNVQSVVNELTIGLANARSAAFQRRAADDRR
jgi:osmotically-inducible protein OsmY